MSKHTPEPWVFSTPFASHLANENYRVFVDVPRPNNMSEEEWEANKRLVSAAPAMLEALERIYNAADHNCGDAVTAYCPACIADEAIKKATGL